MDLIACTGGNAGFTAIAREFGFLYGVRHPDSVRAPVYFADQDWKRPDRRGYMAFLRKHSPIMATVLDLERRDQLPEVLSWAHQAAPHVSDVLIIPKVSGAIARLPREVLGRRVVLAYSVPTRYGGTTVPIEEFRGWPVHLLGGSPRQQVDLWRDFRGVAEVASVDGNFAQKMATRFCQFYMPAGCPGARNRTWPTLSEADGRRWAGDDASSEAFRRSCHSLKDTWLESLDGLRVPV